VTDAALAPFKDCKNLTSLHVNRTAVGDAGLDHFKDCTGLSVVDLRRSNVTPAKIDELKTTRPQLRIVWDGDVIEPR
jgi:hypothetical protein